MRIVVVFLIVSAVFSFADVRWTNDGTAICTIAGDQYSPTIVSDGSGGAIITWYDYRSGNSDIYAQRISSGGVAQWADNGVAICTITGGQYYPTIVSDGSGGAIITWYDLRNGNYDIYTQRISSAGVVQWADNGVAICTAANNQEYPTIVSDGSGGAIITWQDNRSGNYDIYAQRISSNGTVQWTFDGVAICTAVNNQRYPTIVSDGFGGAIITWEDYRSGTNYDIYARRISSGGIVQWAVNGVAICTATGDQNSPTIVSDGSGGAIITWNDYRSGTNWDIYAQRINLWGVVQWAPNGVVICTAANNQEYPTIVSDGSGGAIITWYDYRSGGTSDIYAQRINSVGVVQWADNGVAICTAANDQYYPKIVSDGSGGAIITWYDLRSGTNYDIYAQKVNDTPIINSIAPNSGPNNGQISVSLSGSNFSNVGGNPVVKLTKSGQVDIIATNVSVVSSISITCTFDLTNKYSGLWDVVVTNPDSKFATLTNGFTINAVPLLDNSRVNLNGIIGSYNGPAPKVYSFPNPFNPNNGSLSIRLGLSSVTTNTRIKIYTFSGKLVIDAGIANLSGGNYWGFSWDGKNMYGSIVAPGVYFLVANNDGAVVRHKVVVKY